jgi:resuscitation-promoting factor RpfB
VEVFVRRSLQFSLFAVVLLGLIGGTLAYVAAQKSVTLTVDGQVRTVGTYAGTVGDVLDEEGLEPAAHDVLLPAADQVVADGDAVILNRARPLELTVDGVSRQVYVTALSVDEALAQLGYRADGLVLSASRSERLPLRGMELTITTPKEIVLVSDGQERVVTTTAATAGDLLAEQGIALSETDRTSLYLGQGC